MKNKSDHENIIVPHDVMLHIHLVNIIVYDIVEIVYKLNKFVSFYRNVLVKYDDEEHIDLENKVKNDNDHDENNVNIMNVCE